MFIETDKEVFECNTVSELPVTPVIIPTSRVTLPRGYRWPKVVGGQKWLYTFGRHYRLLSGEKKSQTCKQDFAGGNIHMIHKVCDFAGFLSLVLLREHVLQRLQEEL